MDLNLGRVRRVWRLALLLPLLVFAVAGVSGCSASAAGTTVHGDVKVSGSTALQPLATQAAALFAKQQSTVHVTVSGGGSVAGLQDVTTGKSDIGDSDIYADPALYPDPNLTDHLVCVVPFAMVVNNDVTSITSLTQQEIIDIFSTGAITNWKQVGGPDLAIVPIVRPATSGTRATFRKYILGGRDENGTLLQSDSSQTVLDTVANTPGAIGYLALSVITSDVRQLAIDGQTATRENIEAGRYAFWGFEHMYTLGDTPPIAAYLSFMLTPAVQQLAQQLGYIPIADMHLTSVQSSSGQGSSLAMTANFAARRERSA